jgi:predicted transcriptional regulator
MKRGVTDEYLEKKIIELLSKEILSISQLSKKLGVRKDLVEGYCEALKNQGKLKFQKVGKSNVYTVLKQEKELK